MLKSRAGHASLDKISSDGAKPLVCLKVKPNRFLIARKIQPERQGASGLKRRVVLRPVGGAVTELGMLGLTHHHEVT